MNNIEKAILNIIERRYKRKYVKGIQVTQLASGGYKLVLDLGNPDQRMIQISADIEDQQEFIKYIEKELISRQLQKVEFFAGIKSEIEDEIGRTNCKN